MQMGGGLKRYAFRAGWAMALNLACDLAVANTQGVIDRSIAWKASDTKTGSKVNGEIILNVCWDASSFSNLSVPGGRSASDWQKDIKTHVEQYWNGYAGIRFVFTSSNCDVVINHADRRFKDDGVSFWAPNSAVGSLAKAYVAGGKPSTTLCFTYQNYNPLLIQTTTFSTSTNSNSYTYNPGYHNVALLAQATHEFGHILGLYHEQDHSGKPISCEVKVDNGIYESIGEYDESSIMNYCNGNYARRQYTPSCGDIASIRTLYGMHPSERKSPECINECASGLDEGSLTKTGANLVACKVPANTIIGTMTDYPIRAMQFDNPDEVVTQPQPGEPRTESPIVLGSATSGSNDTWSVSFWIANPNSVMYPHSVREKALTLYTPSSGFRVIEQYDNYDASPLVGATFTIPKGTGPISKPSNLHFTVTQTQPKKVVFSSAEYVTYDYRYLWPSTPYYLVLPDQVRVNLTPYPASVAFFNALDGNTPVPNKGQALIPAKYQDGAMSIKPFFMDKTEVTQRDYMAIMKEFPFKWPGEVTAPAEGMTLYDAILYCNRRSALEGLTPVYTYATTEFDAEGNCTRMTGIVVDVRNNGYRVPSQAEWNHAFKAGTTTDFYWGNANTTNPLPYGWFKENSGITTHPVAKKIANPWGLYDMAGNVREWTLNLDYWYEFDPYDYQCAQGSDYAQDASYATGNPMGSYNFRSCGGSGSKWPMIGFRPIRNAPSLVPILFLLQ